MKKILLMLSLLSVVTTTYSAEEQEEKGYKLDAIRVFGGNGKKYRIPSLLFTKDGKLLAVADGRNRHPDDYGDIDTVIRISDDLGNTFGEEKDIINLQGITTRRNNTSSAFTIDPSLLENGDEILMLVDMFPKSKGTWTAIASNPGSGYTEIDGKKYQNLNKYDDTTYNYFIEDSGKVFKREIGTENQLQETNLNVVRETNQPFNTLGDIYDTSTNERIGNIFRGRLTNETDENLYDGEYIVDRTMYLWLTRSNDQGKTWSSPIDISKNFKPNDVSFLGTGPGIGIKLKNGEHAGRLLFPVYMMTTYNNGRRNDLTNQQSALIYSDDNGQTWNLGESIMEGRINPLNDSVLSRTSYNLGGLQLTESQVVELNDGTLKLFMRGYHESTITNPRQGAVHMGTSHDGGVTWDDIVEELPFEAGFSQVSAIHYGNVGSDEFILVSTTGHRKTEGATKDRSDNTIHLGLVKGDSIDWIAQRQYVEGQSAYSSIAKLSDGDIGILYEVGDKEAKIDYTRVSLDWIAPNYVFKDFLPFPKDYTKIVYRKELSDILNESYNFGSDLDLEKGNVTLRYNRGKFLDKQYNSIEGYGILKGNFGIYSRLTESNGKEFSGNISGYALFDNDYINGYQTLGLDYVKGKEHNFNVRGYKINMSKNDSLVLNASTKLKIKGFNFKEFSLIPEANLDIQYLPKEERKAINQEGIGINLVSNGSYNINTGVGLNLSYKGEKVKTEIGVGVLNNHTSVLFEDKDYKENRQGYKLKASLDFEASNNFTIGTKIKYSNEFKNENFGNLNGSIEVNYSW